MGHAFPAPLTDGHDRLGLLVILVGQDARDDVDGARAALQRQARVAVHRHAAEHVVGPREGRIVVENVGIHLLRANGRRGDRGQQGRAKRKRDKPLNIICLHENQTVLHLARAGLRAEDVGLQLVEIAGNVLAHDERELRILEALHLVLVGIGLKRRDRHLVAAHLLAAEVDLDIFKLRLGDEALAHATLQIGLLAARNEPVVLDALVEEPDKDGIDGHLVVVLHRPLAIAGEHRHVDLAQAFAVHVLDVQRNVVGERRAHQLLVADGMLELVLHARALADQVQMAGIEDEFGRL